MTKLCYQTGVKTKAVCDHRSGDPDVAQGSGETSHFNEPIKTVNPQRKVTRAQTKEDCDMGDMGGDAEERRGEDKTSSLALCLEEGMEEQERRPAQDRACQTEEGVEGEAGGATAVVGPDFPQGEEEVEGETGGTTAVVDQDFPQGEEEVEGETGGATAVVDRDFPQGEEEGEGETGGTATIAAQDAPDLQEGNLLQKQPEGD